MSEEARPPRNTLALTLGPLLIRCRVVTIGWVSAAQTVTFGPARLLIGGDGLGAVIMRSNKNERTYAIGPFSQTSTSRRGRRYGFITFFCHT